MKCSVHGKITFETPPPHPNPLRGASFSCETQLTQPQPLIAHLVGTFAVVPHSPLLYCGSICVTEFGHKGPQFEALLFEMLGDFSRAVFGCLQVRRQGKS